MATKTIIALVLAVVITGAIYGGYQYPKSQVLGNSNSAGVTYSTSKIAEENLVTATDTVFSMLNTDVTDRIIMGFNMYGLSGAATTSQYGIICATSTTAGAVGPSTSSIVNQNLSQGGFGTTTGALNPLFIATSSPGLTGTSTASTLPGGVNAFARVWATNSYLNCKLTDTVTGANAANTLDAATKGFISFPYTAQ